MKGVQITWEHTITKYTEHGAVRAVGECLISFLLRRPS